MPWCYFNFGMLKNSNNYNKLCLRFFYFQASPKVFSAGLDITEMFQPKVDRAKEFWTSLQDLWLNLYGSTLPTAAAIVVNF